MPDADAARQVDYFADNARDFGIEYFDILDPRQGIEHVVAPEQGLVMPGMVIAAGDSHTTAYGAFGALGYGIGTSDIEHYLATSTVRYRRLKTMRINVTGRLPLGVTLEGHRHGDHPAHRRGWCHRLCGRVRRPRRDAR